jgi:hypothetical protein
MQHGWDGLVDFFRKLKARGGLQEALNYLDGAMGSAAVDFKAGRCGLDHRLAKFRRAEELIQGGFQRFRVAHFHGSLGF